MSKELFVRAEEVAGALRYRSDGPNRRRVDPLSCLFAHMYLLLSQFSPGIPAASHATTARAAA